MNAWELPTSVRVAGVVWDIETDYRYIIDVLIAFNNPEYDDIDKWLYCMISLVKDFDNLDEDDYTEMCKALSDFIDMGQKDSKKKPTKIMDWEQDASIIIPAVNNVARTEVRAVEYMHWWTFLSYYMEIRDKSLYSSILAIRQKKAKGKKLEKYEQEFYKENKDIIDLHHKLTDEEIEEQKAFDALFE